MESKVGFFFVAQVSPRKSLAQKTPKAGDLFGSSAKRLGTRWVINNVIK